METKNDKYYIFYMQETGQTNKKGRFRRNERNDQPAFLPGSFLKHQPDRELKNELDLDDDYAYTEISVELRIQEIPEEFKDEFLNQFGTEHVYVKGKEVDKFLKKHHIKRTTKEDIKNTF